MKAVINIILVIALSHILGCTSYKKQLAVGVGNVEQARENAIIDFANSYKMQRCYLKENEGESFKAFTVYQREVRSDLWSFSITPIIDDFLSLSMNDTLGEVPEIFPNKYTVKEGKLFVWRDSITPLAEDILIEIEKIGMLDSTEIKWKLGLPPDVLRKFQSDTLSLDELMKLLDPDDTRVIIIDHRLKSVRYHFCKDNIDKYMKVFTNKHIKYDRISKLKCNR